MSQNVEITGTAVKDETLGEVSATGERRLSAEEIATVEQANQAVADAYKQLEKVFSAPMPVGRVQWLHISQVQSNDYNPNSVAKQEMKLLHTSISADGYTQPVVAVWDPESEKAVIVDGYHRYTTMRKYPDIYDATGGYLPVVIIDKPIADRIASTVRHNRARGKHSVNGMGNLVFQMLTEGEDDAAICNKLGLEAQELARLKHITGFSKLFEGVEYSRAALAKAQLQAKAQYKREHPEETVPQF